MKKQHVHRLYKIVQSCIALLSLPLIILSTQTQKIDSSASICTLSHKIGELVPETRGNIVLPQELNARALPREKNAKPVSKSVSTTTSGLYDVLMAPELTSFLLVH